MRLNFYASSVLHSTSARSKTRGSPEYSTSENQFSEVFRSEFSVLFCTQTENSELKTSEFSPRASKVYPNNDFFLLNCVTSRILIKLGVFFQLQGFVFALHPKPKTRRWKTSEFDLIITVLSVVQNGKLGVGKPLRLIKVHQRKSARFLSPSSRFWL